MPNIPQNQGCLWNLVFCISCHGLLVSLPVPFIVGPFVICRVYSDTLRQPLLSSTQDVSCMMSPHKSPAPDAQRFYTRRRLWHYWSAMYCLFPALNSCCEEHAVKRVLTTMTEPALSEVFKQTRNFYCVAQPPIFFLHELIP